MDHLNFPACNESGKSLTDTAPLFSFLNRFAQRTGEDAFFAQEMGISSKDAYLNFRAGLKSWIRKLGEDQKALRKLSRHPGGNSMAQTRLAMRAPVITALIEVRRAGKTWSADSRRSAEELAA